MIRQLKLLIVALALLSKAGGAIAQEDLAENLKIFKPFLGKTWRGELNDPGMDKPATDVARWERALNGQAVRVLHSVNNGEYGGESIIVWDKAKKSLVFYYFTTAGFYTSGTMTIENGKFISHEYVTGNTNGISEVKGISEATADGKMVSKSQYLQNGKWVDGHSTVYTEDASAQVLFK
ncbi:MAG: hypothetical protein ACREOO_24240 [bacterium]